MDSKHKHEHSNDDWSTFIHNAKECWASYGQMTMTVIIIVALSFTAVSFFRNQTLNAHEDAWGGLAQSTSPDSYRAVASSNKGAVKALALIRGADLLLAQATVPAVKPKPVTDVQVKEGDAKTEAEDVPAKVTLAEPVVQDPKVLLDDAKVMYQGVIADEAVHVVLRMNAILGIASVCEAQGLWDEAAIHYDNVVALAGTQYDVLAKQASGRKEQLAQIKEPVKFAKAPEIPKAKIPMLPKTQDKAPAKDAAASIEIPALPGLSGLENKKEAAEKVVKEVIEETKTEAATPAAK